MSAQPKSVQPKSVLWKESFLLEEMIEVNPKYKALINDGWTFYVVNQVRGRCYYGRKWITIPVHAWKRQDDGYLVYYVAHEAAHAYAGASADHGPKFMAWLKKLCPAQYIHYELTYKPRQAFAAGIMPEDF